jgi:hypothetical protein
MLDHLKKFKEFALEMIIGFLVGSIGLIQLLLKIPIIGVAKDIELNEKIAAALVTIGGTVLLSGIFRFAISVRLENAEKRILGAVAQAGRDFIGTIASLQPKALTPRPNDEYGTYRFLYWRTKDELGNVMWLSFSRFAWRTRVLPFFDAHANIKGVKGTFRYFLAMVQLQNCVVVTATRVNPDDTPFGEMAGVYVFPIPIGAADHLCGFLRHQNMGGRQSLSSCVLSAEEIRESSDLDRIWVRGAGEMQVDRNFPNDEVLAPQMAAK